MNEDSWNNKLVREAQLEAMPQWVRDLIAKGMPKSLVITAALKLDRDQSAEIAYGVF